MNWTSYNIEMLYEWIEKGQPSSVSEEFAQYVNMLSKIFNMKQRFDVFGDKEAILKHLVTFEPDIKGNRIKALKLYNEAMEYFYGDTELPRNVLRNMAAERLEKDAQLARLLAQNPTDLEKVSKIEERAYKMRSLDKDDPEEIDDALFKKPIKLYTYDMDHFEVGNEDRKSIEEFIETKLKKLTPKAKDRIKQEAMLLPIKIFQDEQEDPRKD